MQKTDKELTAEIVCAMVQAGGMKNTPLVHTAIPGIIAAVHEAIRNLPEQVER